MTSPRQQDIFYSDFRADFGKHPIKKDLSLLTNEDAVTRSIRNLLLTNHYECPFEPNKGANITAWMFENVNSLTELAIETSVREAIITGEPRAKLLDVKVNMDNDNNSYSVNVVYSLINKTEPITLNLILKRIR